MSKKKKTRIDTSGSGSLTHNPFASLEGLEGAPTPEELPEPASAPKQAKRSRGRVDIIRQTAHRGGKAVIVITHFKGIGLPEKKALAKQMQKACGTGGTVKNGNIEIQGDHREEVKRILEEAGFQPVFAGG